MDTTVIDEVTKQLKTLHNELSRRGLTFTRASPRSPGSSTAALWGRRPPPDDVQRMSQAVEQGGEQDDTHALKSDVPVGTKGFLKQVFQLFLSISAYKLCIK